MVREQENKCKPDVDSINLNVSRCFPWYWFHKNTLRSHLDQLQFRFHLVKEDWKCNIAGPYMGDIRQERNFHGSMSLLNCKKNN